MSLPARLLRAYQLEYESSDLSLEDICVKYHVSMDELKGSDKWTKVTTNQVEILDKPQKRSSAMTRVATNIAETQLAPEEIPQDNEITDSIAEFKKLALGYAIKFMKENVEFADVKEFKDIVSVVDTIERSYKGNTQAGTTVNVAVQSLVDRFSDDC